MKNILNKIKNHLIPNTENEHLPHLLKHRFLNFLFTLVIVLELSFLVQYFIVFNKTDYLALVLPNVLVEETNQKRLENNTNTLSTNSLLEQAALAKANDMASKGYFSHNTPDGKTPWYFLEQVNYKYKYAGENLAVNFTDSKDVVEAWMNSPGHRANIVKKEYTEIGIAVAEGIYEGRNAVFVVQFFGTPNNSIKPSSTIQVALNTGIQNLDNNVLGEEVKITPKVETQKSTPKKIASNNEVKKTITENTTPIPKEESKNQNLENTETKVVSNIKENISTTNRDLRNLIKDFGISPNYTITNLLFVILGLFLVIFMIYLIKTEIMHPRIILHSTALVFIIFMLLFMNIKVWHNNIEIPENESSFTEIAL